MLTKEGEIDYVCTPHHAMFGMLMVGPALSATDDTPAALGVVPPLIVSGVLLVFIVGWFAATQLRRRRIRA